MSSFLKSMLFGDQSSTPNCPESVAKSVEYLQETIKTRKALSTALSRYATTTTAHLDACHQLQRTLSPAIAHLHPDIGMLDHLQQRLIMLSRVLVEESIVPFAAYLHTIKLLCAELQDKQKQVLREFHSRNTLASKLEGTANMSLLGGNSGGATQQRYDILREHDLCSDRLLILEAEFISGVDALRKDMDHNLINFISTFNDKRKHSLVKGLEHINEHHPLLYALDLRGSIEPDVVVLDDYVQKEQKLNPERTVIVPSTIVRSAECELELLEGELLRATVHNVTDIRGNSKSLGVLYVTNYRVVLHEYNLSGSPLLLMDIPLTSIDQCEIKDEAEVVIATKDLLVFTIGFCNSLDKLDTALAFMRNRDKFCYSYTPNHDVVGWDIYNPELEFGRMGIPDESFRISLVNMEYRLASTYPRILAVPTNFTDSQLECAAAFRSKQRLITVVWRRKGSHQAILRCSQPCVGITRNRNEHDESYVSHLADLVEKHSSVSLESVLICDSRPQANAVANIALGGGWESTAVYTRTRFEFQNIPNIHVVRESFRNLRDLFSTRLSKSDPESSQHLHQWSKRYNPLIQDLRMERGIANWFSHISRVIAGANQVTGFIGDGGSVIVHCSDGWDRTPQVSAMSQLLLDPYYRTMEGFMILVDKEWRSFGHKFGERLGNGNTQDCMDTQRSPVFLQWLDCVFQVLYQHPSAFQFNSEFLCCIASHLYTCLYGNFLFDCESERLKVPSTTPSLWGYILSNKQRYTNTGYAEVMGTLVPSSDTCQLNLWLHYYCRWDPALLKTQHPNWNSVLHLLQTSE